MKERIKQGKNKSLNNNNKKRDKTKATSSHLHQRMDSNYRRESFGTMSFSHQFKRNNFFISFL
jgi:hypothetical protein